MTTHGCIDGQMVTAVQEVTSDHLGAILPPQRTDIIWLECWRRLLIVRLLAVLLIIIIIMIIIDPTITTSARGGCLPLRS
jgi:hypothetical protein